VRYGKKRASERDGENAGVCGTCESGQQELRPLSAEQARLHCGTDFHFVSRARSSRVPPQHTALGVRQATTYTTTLVRQQMAEGRPWSAVTEQAFVCTVYV
jgi:hypothetical protein